MNRSKGALFICSSLVLMACGGDDSQGKGTVQVTAYGESFIEDGIPASAVSDGWVVDFDRFDVTIRDVRVGGLTLAGPVEVDLSTPSDGEGHELGALTVRAGDHDGSSFTIQSVAIEGTATTAADAKTFAWALDAATEYRHCETTTRVRPDGTATFQITIHADHLLYDSLVSSEPGVLFQALADADADGDGVIDEAELGVADIGAYDPGNEDIDDLWAWLVAQSRTLGHVDGEGHCDAAPSGG
jgi:hypothetical protein